MKNKRLFDSIKEACKVAKLRTSSMGSMTAELMIGGVTSLHSYAMLGISGGTYGLNSIASISLEGRLV